MHVLTRSVIVGLLALLPSLAWGQQGPSPGNITTPQASDFVPLYGRGSNAPLFGQVGQLAAPLTGLPNVWTALQTFTAGVVNVLNLGELTDANSGVAMTSQMTSQSGLSIYQGLGIPGNYDALSGVANLASGSTIWGVNGIAGYVRNHAVAAGGGINAVAVFGLSTCEVNGCNSWGLNLLQTDYYSSSPTPGTGTGRLLQNEFDFTVSQTGTNVVGLQFSGSTIVTPANAVGIQFYPLGTGFPWNIALQTLDGAAVYAAVFGAQSASANANGQIIDLLWRNNSAVSESVTLQAQDGFLVVAGSTGFNGITVTGSNISLQSSYSYVINGVPVLSATALGSVVTGSSLTSVGTLASLTMGGNIAMGDNSLTGVASVVGNANLEMYGTTGNSVYLGTASDGAALVVYAGGSVVFPNISNVSLGSAAHAFGSFFGGAASLNTTSTTGTALNTSGTVYMASLTAGSGTSALCLTSGNQVETDTSSTICGISALRFKDIEGSISAQESLDGVMSLRTTFWRYKSEYQDHGAVEHVGPIADDVARMNPRCGVLDEDKQLQNYADRCVEGYLIGSIHALKADNDNLRAEIEALKTGTHL